MNTEQKIIKNKLGRLKLSEMLGSVSEACFPVRLEMNSMNSSGSSW